MACAEALRDVGQGRVHDYLYRQYFAREYSEGRTCCGGFAVLRGQVHYSSIWLNQQSSSIGRLVWKQDGSKYLSQLETGLVDAAVAVWKTNGPGCLVEVPDWVHNQSLALCPVAAPAQQGCACAIM